MLSILHSGKSSIRIGPLSLTGFSLTAEDIDFRAIPECMCGRFGLFARLDAIEDHYDAEFTFEYEPRYNIAPEGSGIAAVKNESPDEINNLQWGLLPRCVDDPDDFPNLINARAESVANKSSFKDAFKKRRCLIPANNFYEWTGRKGARRPFSIGVEEQELFSMAGIWETWRNNGTEVQSVAIITTDANDVVAELHDRMPVILDGEEEEAWLETKDENALHELLYPYPAEDTRSYEVATAVNNPGNEGPELIEPLGSDQSGIGDFV